MGPLRGLRVVTGSPGLADGFGVSDGGPPGVLRFSFGRPGPVDRAELVTWDPFGVLRVVTGNPGLALGFGVSDVGPPWGP